MQLELHCHCGDLRGSLSWPDGVDLVGRACGCGYCTRFAAIWTSHPDASLRLSGSPRRYRFGTQTADFLFCRHCGGLIAAHSRIDGHDYAVVNLRLAEVDLEALSVSGTDFEGEATPARLQRRAERWIRHVGFVD